MQPENGRDSAGSPAAEENTATHDPAASLPADTTDSRDGDLSSRERADSSSAQAQSQEHADDQSGDDNAGQQFVENYEAGLRAALGDAVRAKDSHEDGEPADVSDGEPALDETQNHPDQPAAPRDGQQNGQPQTDGNDSEQDAEADSEQDNTTGDDEVSAEEDLPFNKHPRFRKLIDQRNELKNARSELQGQVDDMTPRAQEYDQIQRFMHDNDLGAQDVAEGFRIMALMNADPAAARDALAERMQQLDAFTGHVLPDDLQRAVDDGMVTEDMAREHARLRNQRAFEAEKTARERKVTERSTQQRQAEQAAERQRAEQGRAVSDWESKIAQRDPDYARKQPWIVKELRLLVNEQPPQSADDAVTLARQAYDNVSRELASLLPRREEKRRRATSADSAAGTAADKPPASYQEAIQRAAELN